MIAARFVLAYGSNPAPTLQRRVVAPARLIPSGGGDVPHVAREILEKGYSESHDGCVIVRAFKTHTHIALPILVNEKPSLDCVAAFRRDHQLRHSAPPSHAMEQGVAETTTAATAEGGAA